MKTILASVYSVNPYKGSEEGMGWNYVYQAARFNRILAVTRENNRMPLERFMRENPDAVYQNIHFLYYDLPYWARFWKKGSRGVIFYYLLWQYFLPAFVRKQRVQFDIVHNMNFHNDWSPSFLWKLGKPFIWGPVGHHPLIPSVFLKGYSKSYWLKDRLTWFIKQFFWNCFPALRTTIKKADYIWSMNSSVGQVIPIAGKEGHVSPSVATQDFGWIKQRSENFTLISAGRLVPLKGYDLTIRAFARFINALSAEERKRCELLIVGSGPEEGSYKEQVTKYGIGAHVRFIEWIERNALMALMKNASVFMFPSHEGAGMVVPEALSFGLPVICLDNCGPGEFINKRCGFAVKATQYEATASALSEKIMTLFTQPVLLQQMQHEARLHFEEHFHWDRRGEQLLNIYNRF
jgi:glycosyltransferase involved in cell wall biosynthesis